MYISQIALVKIDKTVDFVPFLSLVSGVVGLFIKAVYIPTLDDTKIRENCYISHINDKEYWRIAALCVPILGNIAVALYDCCDSSYKIKKIREKELIESNHKKAIECVAVFIQRGIRNVAHSNLSYTQKLLEASVAFDPSYKDGVTLYSLAVIAEALGQECQAKYFAAAELGHLEAQHKMGEICVRNKNDTEATNWFKKAADQGHPPSQYKLGKYYSSYNNEKELNLALEYLLLAHVNRLEYAKDGLFIVYNKLAKFFESIVPNTQENNIKAFNYYEQASSLDDNPEAYLKMAEIYEYGLLQVEKNDEKALEWYSKVAPAPISHLVLTDGTCVPAPAYEESDVIKKARLKINELKMRVSS